MLCIDDDVLLGDRSKVSSVGDCPVSPVSVRRAAVVVGAHVSQTNRLILRHGPVSHGAGDCSHSPDHAHPLPISSLQLSAAHAAPTHRCVLLSSSSCSLATFLNDDTRPRERLDLTDFPSSPVPTRPDRPKSQNAPTSRQLIPRPPRLQPPLAIGPTSSAGSRPPTFPFPARPGRRTAVLPCSAMPRLARPSRARVPRRAALARAGGVLPSLPSLPSPLPPSPTRLLTQ